MLIRKKIIYKKGKETQNKKCWVAFRKLPTFVKKQPTTYHKYINRMLDVDDNNERTTPKKFGSSSSLSSSLCNHSVTWLYIHIEKNAKYPFLKGLIT